MRDGPEYFDRAGRPITFDEWARLWQPEYKRVALDELGEIRISTVWLGLDHRFGDAGPPLIFETMIFGGTLDGEQSRYSTEEQARAGHAHWISLVRLEIDAALEIEPADDETAPPSG